MSYLVSRINRQGLIEYVCQHSVQSCFGNPDGFYLSAGNPELMTNIYRFSYRSDADRIANDDNLRSFWNLLSGELVVEDE
jgi:hypothetical protein